MAHRVERCRPPRDTEVALLVIGWDVLPSPIVRVFALLIALTGAFAAPISALAHGHAHQHEAAEHESAPSGSTLDDVATAENRDHGDGDHAHPSVGAALTSKVAMPLGALVAPRVALPPATGVRFTPAAVDATVEPRANLAHAPPPRLRAPPA